MIYTAEHFMNSPAFLEIATQDAVALVAQANGQAYSLTLQALVQQVPNVVRQVARLISRAAEHCADEANAGRLWG
jgi:hypothetical protein